MKNSIILLFTCFLGIVKLNAQMHYSLNPSLGTFAPMTSGTFPFLIGNGSDPVADEGYANNIPIGFSFTYNGSNTYNELSVSTNGFISFEALSSSYVENNLTSGAFGERPIVAPLWDDINLDVSYNLHYATTGTAPNRVFTMEWLNARWGFGATTASISFQVKLYETSNWIEFSYRQENGNALSPSASIGLSAANIGSNNFISLLNATTTPAASLTTEAANIAAKPTSNQKYLFQPGVLPVSFGSFSVAKSNGSNILNWQTLNEINNNGFEIERSVDGKNFNTIAYIGSKATNGNSSNSINYTSTDFKPIDGTNYYRIKQLDKDGKVNYSAIVSVKNDIGNGWATISIYPNPVKEKLNVQLNTKQQTEVVITVYNDLGMQLIQKNYMVIAGTSQLFTDVAYLPTGRYTVKVTGSKNEMPLIKTFVK